MSNYGSPLIITRFLARIICPIQIHIRKGFYCYKQHSPLNVCNICKKNGAKIKYVYTCANCMGSFCYPHYSRHLQLFTPISHLIKCNSKQIILTDKLVKAIPLRKCKELVAHYGKQIVKLSVGGISSIETQIGYVLKITNLQAVDGRININFWDMETHQIDYEKSLKCFSVLAIHLNKLRIQYVGNRIKGFVRQFIP